MSEKKSELTPEKNYERVEPVMLRNMLKVFAGNATAVLEQAGLKKERFFLENLTDEEWMGLARRIQNELDRGDPLPALMLTEILIDFVEEGLRPKEITPAPEDDDTGDLDKFLEDSQESVNKVKQRSGLAKLQEYEKDLILDRLVKREPKLYAIADVREWLQIKGAQIAQRKEQKEASTDLLQAISNVLAGTADANDAKIIHDLIINFELKIYRDTAIESLAEYLYGKAYAKDAFEKLSEQMLRLKQFRSILNEYAKN